MKKIIRILLATIMTLSLMVSMTACGDKKDNTSSDDQTKVAAEEQQSDDAKDSDEASDDENSSDDSKSDSKDENVGPSEGAKIIDTIENIDQDGDKLNMPLQITAINLYDDGTVEIVPNSDLKEIELRGSDASAVYPFADFGNAKKIYLVNYGNAGYRTIIALMSDGTVAAVNGRALVEDHILTVAPHITGRDDYKSVKNVKDDGGYGVIGITTEGKEIDLDNSLNLQ